MTAALVYAVQQADTPSFAINSYRESITGDVASGVPSRDSTDTQTSRSQVLLEPVLGPCKSALERLADLRLLEVRPAPEAVRRARVVVPDARRDGEFLEEREDGGFLAVERKVLCEVAKLSGVSDPSGGA